jgi:hypothetical protein
VLERAPTLEAAKIERDKIRQKSKTNPPQPITLVENVIRRVVDSNSDLQPSEFEAKVHEQVELYRTNQPEDQPTLAFWLDGAGWYAMNGGTGGKRFNNLAAATATYWLNPGSGGTRWLRLRYEVGRERAAPADRKNGLTLSLGTAF